MSGRTYAGRSDLERRAERRARLLAAGFAHLGTRGYAKTTIGGVCQDAKVTARHFYQAFPSLEALLVAVYDQVIAQTRARVLAAAAAAAAGRKSLRSQIEAGVAAFVHAYVDDPRCVRIACIECVGVSAALERHRRAVIRDFAALIAERAQTLGGPGRAPGRDVSLVALALAGATNEVLVDWVFRRPRPTPARIIAELTDLYLAALGPRRR
jgi:AcrR family transcriptional regulator